MGNCYEANLRLFLDMTEAGEDVVLCHGIVVAPKYYEHMKPGRHFMHCWVEANSEEHGKTVHDYSDRVDGTPEYTWFVLETFEEHMNPRFVVRMGLEEVQYHIMTKEFYGAWDLHPEHKKCGR